MDRNGNGVQRVGDTMMRRARRPPYPRTQQNTTTLPLRTRPTSLNKLHYTTLGQTKKQLTSTDKGVRRCNHRQQRDGNNANQADHEAAKTTAHHAAATTHQLQPRLDRKQTTSKPANT